VKGASARSEAAVGQDTEVVSLCAFEVNGGAFAIDLRRVREILRPARITAVPKAPAYVEGVIDLRGAVIPVVDLRKRLGVAAPQASALNRLVVVWMGRREVGLLVDRVTGVVRLQRGELLPAPDLWLEGGARLFVGACRDGGSELRLLLNLKALLTSAEAVPAESLERLRGQATLPRTTP
jgi:purine-binding chemotaxis protein CheW